METKTCVYPGSFDPMTLGHLDIIERISKQFPKICVAVLDNPDKKKKFTVDERIAMLQSACKHLPNVEIDNFSGLLVDYMLKLGAGFVVRGLRSASDFETEFQMAQTNAQLSNAVESVFLMTSPQFAYISSSIVKQIASFGGDISAFVPECILPQITKRFSK